MNEQTLTVDLALLTFLGGTLIPLLTALVTKAEASSKVKALTTLFLAVVAAGVESVIAQGGAVNVQSWLLAIGTTYISAIASYYGLTKPTEVTGAIQRKTADFGIGPDVSLAHYDYE